MTIEERARELWGKLPIIQEDYISVIQAALEEQKAEYDSQLPLIKETYYNAGYETAKNKMIDKAVAWVDHNVGTMSAMALRKAMED